MDVGYFNALVRTFAQALKAIAAMPDETRPAFFECRTTDAAQFTKTPTEA